MKKILLIFTFFLILCQTAAAASALRVIATTQDLEYIANRIGGTSVKTESLSSGDQDLHMVEPRPSMVMKLRKADMVIKVGMDLDMWSDSLIAAAKNPNIIYGASGYVDASVRIPLLQVPKGKVDAGMGDIHIFGNPHYWLDPANSKIIADNIRDGLCRLRPEECSFFNDNSSKFKTELDVKLSQWLEKMEKLKGSYIVTYHNSWVYFAKRFGLEIAGNIEPKPGIPPSPAHLDKLIKDMKNSGARIIMAENYFPKHGPRKVSEATGAKVVLVPSSVGGLPGIKTYFDLFDRLTELLSDAFSKEKCSGEDSCSN